MVARNLTCQNTGDRWIQGEGIDVKKSIFVLLAVALLLSGCVKTPPAAEPPLQTEQQTEMETVVQPVTIPTEPTLPETEPITKPSELPTEPPTETERDAFVRAADYIPHLRVELAYATTENFTGTVVYEFTDAYLRYGTVQKLVRAAEILKEQGYGLVIWDAYRPVYAQERLWEICPDPAYVSKPGTGSQSHCRGLAVDVSLYDLETGEILEMPTDFDSFTALADRDYTDCTCEAASNAILLEDTLTFCGFTPYSAEWWHFSDVDSYDIEYAFDPANLNN